MIKLICIHPNFFCYGQNDQEMSGEKMPEKLKARLRAFCMGQHWDDKCKNSQGPNKERNVWRNCIFAGNAYYSKKCFYCKRYHNTALYQTKSNQLLNRWKVKRMWCSSITRLHWKLRTKFSNIGYLLQRKGSFALLWGRGCEPWWSNWCPIAMAFFDVGSQLTFVTQDKLSMRKQKRWYNQHFCVCWKAVDFSLNK